MADSKKIRSGFHGNVRQYLTMATHTSTPASAAAALARLGSADAVAAALEAADLPLEILTAIEVASIAAAESANKRRLMAIDVRNDALGRVGTIQTLIKLLGRHAGSLVCRRWRDSSRALALTKFEEDRLVLAVAEDHTNPRLLANLSYYDVTTLNLRRRRRFDTLTDAAVIAFSKGCRNLVNVDLYYRCNITDAAITALAANCPKISKISLEECHNITDAAIATLAAGCRTITEVDLSKNTNVTDASFAALATGGVGSNLTNINLNNTKIGEVGVTAIATACRQLTNISLRGTDVTDVAATALGRGCRSLLHIDLQYATDITDDGVTELATGCCQLKSICLVGTGVTDAGVCSLATNCRQLTCIELDYLTTITDGAVIALATGCLELEYISLSYNHTITDASLVALANGFPKLANVHLYVHDRHLTVPDAAVEALENSHPGISVSIE